VRVRIRGAARSSTTTPAVISRVRPGRCRPSWTQGLCSPWQNDYPANCSCYYYWASARGPDYVRRRDGGINGLQQGLQLAAEEAAKGPNTCPTTTSIRALVELRRTLFRGLGSAWVRFQVGGSRPLSPIARRL